MSAAIDYIQLYNTSTRICRNFDQAVAFLFLTDPVLRRSKYRLPFVTVLNSGKGVSGIGLCYHNSKECA